MRYKEMPLSELQKIFAALPTLMAFGWIWRALLSLLRRLTSDSQQLREQFVPGVLPVELWRRIAELCDPAAAASLALTSHGMLGIVDGPKAWRALNANPSEKLVFLRGLQQHWPMHFLCPKCRIFHRRPRRFCPTPTKRRKFLTTPAFTGAQSDYSDGQCDLRRERINLIYPGDLEWRTAHLVMRSHWLSPRHGIELKTLFFNRPILINSVKHIASTRAYIPPSGHLIVTTKTCAPVSPHDLAGYDTESADFLTCRHHCGPPPKALVDVCKEFRLKMQQSSDTKFYCKTLIYRCRQCPCEHWLYIWDRRVRKDKYSWV